MISKKIRLLALIAISAILVGTFSSCGDPAGDLTESTASTDTTATEQVEGSATESESLSEDLTELETEAMLIPEGDNGELIALSNKLANTADTFYTDHIQESVTVKNSNMSLQYNISGSSKNMQVEALTDKDGNTYLQNTMDVFVRMKDGNTFYASQSVKSASLNIYRYGYYYYENRIEGQDFVGEVEILDDKRVNHLTYNKYNGLKEAPKKANAILSYVIEGGDPWVSFSTGFAAEKYNYLEVTLRAENVSSAAQLFVIAGSHTYFTQEQMTSFALIDDGEFHTYQIPLNGIPDYTGNVLGLRFDINASAGSTVEISAIRAIKAGYGGAPSNLTIQRSFLNYSDKLHHLLQVAAFEPTEDIDTIGILTEIDASTVAKLVVKDKDGLKYTLQGVDWASAEYVGFDIKSAGIFGYILPSDGKSGNIEVTLTDNVYSIIQTKSPDNGTIIPSEEKSRNANDFFMGQRIYTDSKHTFDTFIQEAECERNPLTSENVIIDTEASDNASFVGYDALRGYYKLNLSGTDFNQAYYNYPNKHFRVKFTVKGDEFDRKSYFMTFTNSGNLESAVLLNGEDMLLPVPLEVAKNFNGDGENTVYNLDDAPYGEVYFPLVIKAGEEKSYSVINLYQNWGQFPLKQISSIQFFLPYYHLSTGVTETNCIVPLPTNGPGLPDHRAMSAPFWPTQPQHNSGGAHNFFRYTDADGIYAASNNIGADIDAYGPTYCDVTLTQISSDGKIMATYTHTEMPQTDENRAYYEMKYTVLEDVSFKEFYKSFTFYSVTDNNPKGTYKKVGYLDENNKCQVVTANTDTNTPQRYVLGDECPYFSFFDMPDYDPNYTAAIGYTNLSFLIYNAEFIIGGKAADPSFMLVNNYNYLSLTLDLDEVDLKAGDTFTVNAILMPWGSQESDYSGEEPDANVREVRRNTLLNPLMATANSSCEVLDSIFVPKLKTLNGETAEFTLSGGHNNVAVRIYGFNKLTVPKIEEFVDGKWVEYTVSSIHTPDAYGIGHYYDGYMVHYDGDGTYSYSFVTEMDNGAPRKFRISASDEFEPWPKEDTAEKAPDPINVFIDPNELLDTSIGLTLINRAELADDKSYVRFYGKSGIPEAYFNVYSLTKPQFANVTSTGQYVVFKYRMPAGISSLGSFEFFTSTVNTGAVSGDNIVIQNVVQDGEWHVVIIDLSKRLPAFKPNENGEYLAKYFRFDFFNGAVSPEMYIDFAYVGLSDSLEEILSINADMETVTLVDGSDIITVDPKTGNEHVEASVEYIDKSSGYVKSSVSYASTIDMINGMGGAATHFTGVGSQSNKDVQVHKHGGTTVAGSKLVFSGWAVANGGIEKYVWSADGGKTWNDVVLYNGTGIGNVQQAHVDALVGRTGATVTDLEATKRNGHFQGSVGSGENVQNALAADLSEYAGQTVNITFAAVPYTEPDSLCIILHVTDITVLPNE